MTSTVIDHPSPNHDSRGEHSVELLVLHYTGMETGAKALERLCQREAGVSAHYLLEEDGRLFRLVAEDQRAWHAGVAAWAGQEEVNARSVGIEIVNPGHEWGYRPLAEQQIRRLIPLIREIIQRHQIRPENVVGHSDVAPNRKDDPGELFPWSRLAAKGLAIGPASDAWEGEAPYGERALQMLEEIGYGVPRFGIAACLLQFQRRFLPAELGQSLNLKTRTAIAEVAQAFKDARAR